VLRRHSVGGLLRLGDLEQSLGGGMRRNGPSAVVDPPVVRVHHDARHPVVADLTQAGHALGGLLAHGGHRERRVERAQRSS
jgi:hypothetical protein